MATTPPPEKRGPTPSDPGIERAASDSGQLGDKINQSDPAVAPVNTDAEAGGSPTSRENIERMVEERKATAGRAGATEPGFGRNEQRRHGPDTDTGRTPNRSGTTSARSTQVTVAALIIVAVLAVLLGVLLLS